MNYIEKLIDEWEEENVNNYNNPYDFCEARREYKKGLIKKEKEVDIVVPQQPIKKY